MFVVMLILLFTPGGTDMPLTSRFFVTSAYLNSLQLGSLKRVHYVITVAIP